MERTRYRILAVDDHPIVLEGIQNLAAQMEGVECRGVKHAEAMAEMLKSEVFDLCIIDLELSDTNGLGLIDRLHDCTTNCAILIYTMHEEPWIAAKIPMEKIDGAVSKNSPVEELRTAIGRIRRGEKHFCPVFRKLLEQYAGHTEEEDRNCQLPLSPREREVLRCLAEGMSTNDIAAKLFLSTNTIQTYRKRLMTKLNAKNVAEVVHKSQKWL